MNSVVEPLGLRETLNPKPYPSRGASDSSLFTSASQPQLSRPQSEQGKAAVKGPVRFGAYRVWV